MYFARRTKDVSGFLISFLMGALVLFVATIFVGVVGTAFSVSEIQRIIPVASFVTSTVFVVSLIFVSVFAWVTDLDKFKEIGRIIVMGDSDLRNELESERSLVADKEELIKRQERIISDLNSFAYAAGHDLRGPVTTIKGFLEVFMMPEITDEVKEEAIIHMGKGVIKLEELINSLLNYSRIELRESDMSVVNGNLLLDEVIESMKGGLESSRERCNIVIDVKPLPRDIFVDRGMLHRLFQNLMENAIKFGCELNGNLLIQIDYEETTANYIFSVADNGPGIDEKYQIQIFDIFKRLDPQKSGSGVGLAICRKIVHKHGGQMWVSSSAGNGSVFYFSIPRK